MKATREMKRSRVLYCDDDAEMLGTMSQYLSWYGFEVDPITDVRDIVRHLDSKRYDLLVMSACMEPTDGYALSEALRSEDSPTLKRIKIILLVPEEVPQADHVRATRLGVNFLNKYRGAEKWLEKFLMVLAQGAR